MTVGLIALGAGLALFFVAYAIFAPKKSLPTNVESEIYLDNKEDMSEAALAYDKYVRPMLRNFLPQTPLAASLSAQQRDKITELLIRSGNPWNLRPEEYRATQVLFAFLGFIGGMVATILDPLPGFPIEILLFGFPLLGWAVPFSVMNTAREKRANEVRKQLPEALDLLVVTLSAGQNFEPAMAQITPRLPAGLLQSEFRQINDDLSAGRGMEASLLAFARRAASDEVGAFAKAVIQSQRLGADVTETLEGQAEAARTNYEAMLDKKINRLSSNMFMFIIPTMLPAFMILFVAPTLVQLGSTM